RPCDGASFHLNAPCRIVSNSEGHGAQSKPEQPQPRSGRADQLKVLIVDDQQLIRQGIRSILSADPHISICGEADNGRKAIELARSTRPDIILMDIDMPEMNGVSATQRIMEMLPDTRVLGLSLQEEITVV